MNRYIQNDATDYPHIEVPNDVRVKRTGWRDMSPTIGRKVVMMWMMWIWERERVANCNPTADRYLAADFSATPHAADGRKGRDVPLSCIRISVL